MSLTCIMVQGIHFQFQGREQWANFGKLTKKFVIGCQVKYIPIHAVSRHSTGMLSSSCEASSSMLPRWIISTCYFSIKFSGFGWGYRFIWSWVIWWVEYVRRNEVDGWIGMLRLGEKKLRACVKWGFPIIKICCCAWEKQLSVWTGSF